MSWCAVWKCQLVFAGGGVERDDARGIEVRAGPAVAVVLIDGVAERDEHQTVLVVDGQRLPRARALAILPAVHAPGAEVRIARMRHGVEAPHFLRRSADRSRADRRECPSGCARRCGPGRSRGSCRPRPATRSCRPRRPGMRSMMPFSRSMTPDVGHELPVFASSCTSLPPLDRDQHARRVRRRAGPVGHAAADRAAGGRLAQRELPHLGAGVGVERHDVARRRRST